MKTKQYMFSEIQKKEITIAIKKILDKEPGIKFGYLHGSFLDNLPVHDIDIAIYLDETIKKSEYLKFSIRVGTEISEKVKCEVDCNVLNTAPLSFQFQSMKGVLLINNDDQFFSEKYAYIVSRYLDMEPFLIRYAKEAFGNG